MAPFHFKKCRKKERLPFFLSEIYSLKGDILTGNEVMVRILYVSIKIMWILQDWFFLLFYWTNEENNFKTILNLTKGLSIFFVEKSAEPDTVTVIKWLYWQFLIGWNW